MERTILIIVHHKQLQQEDFVKVPLKFQTIKVVNNNYKIQTVKKESKMNMLFGGPYCIS